MLQQDRADDYVIATGESALGARARRGRVRPRRLDWQKHVKLDPRFLRPAEVDLLIGDPAKAKPALGWKPDVDFERLVTMMVDADLERLSKAQAGLEIGRAEATRATVSELAERMHGVDRSHRDPIGGG